MDFYTLTRAVADLAAIDRAGLLSDLLADIAVANRECPRNDFDRFPLRRPQVERFADLAAGLLGENRGRCLAAAREALLPGNRRQRTLSLITQYAAIADAPPPAIAIKSHVAEDPLIARQRKKRRRA